MLRPQRHPLIRRAVLGGLATTVLGTTAIFGSAPAAAAGAHDPGTVVYTMSNAAAAAGGNAVMAFRRGASGLTSIGAFATGGDGSGVALHSQGALALARDGSRLLAVNAASNTVSLFGIRDDGRLWLIDAAPSGGIGPISVSAHGGLVYVLNAGNNTVSGLRLDATLHALSHSTRTLVSTAMAPEQVGFTPDGRNLVVAEKASNSIDVFHVLGNGRLDTRHTMTVPAGTAPYGFDFDAAGDLVISDAAISSLSSFAVDNGGSLDPIGTVADTQAAACWVVTDRARGRAYTANAGSGTISSYNVTSGGRLTLRQAVATTTGGAPLDEAIGHHELFVLVAPGQISMAAVKPSGDLGAATVGASGLPASAAGLVVLTTG